MPGPYRTPPVQGAAVALSSVPWEVADLTDGSWTLVDPDSLVKSVSHAADENSVVMNALGAGSTNYAWGAGTAHRAPRWHIPLVADDGQGGTVRITSEDTFILQVRITKGTPPADFDTELVCALAEAPASTVPGTLKGVGAILEYISGSNSGYGTWTATGKEAPANANSVAGITTVPVAGRRVPTGTYVSLQSNGVYQTSGSRDANVDLTASTDLFLMVGVGTRGSATIDDNDEVVAKVEYRVIRMAA